MTTGATAWSVGLVNSLAGLPADAVDAFEEVEPSSCCARLLQLESDRVWQVKYLVGLAGNELRALLPLYTSRAMAWSHPLYDPGHVGLPPARPSDVLVVGHVRDLRSPLRVPSDESGPSADTLRLLLDEAASQAQGRPILLPHYSIAAANRLDSATGRRVQWVDVDHHACFQDLGDPHWADKLDRTARQERRHDRRLIERYGLRAEFHQWNEPEEADDRHLSWIVQQAGRSGSPDHVALARRRYADWRALPSVSLLKCLLLQGNEEVGVASALHWRDQLVMYEVGMPGPRCRKRLATYVLMFSEAPIEFARAKGIRAVHLGYTNSRMKMRRGASAQLYRYGWLPPRG